MGSEELPRQRSSRLEGYTRALAYLLDFWFKYDGECGDGGGAVRASNGAATIRLVGARDKPEIR